MSNFNPRAHMQAQKDIQSSKAGPKLDGLTITVLIVVGLAGSLFGYNTLMDFRHKNQTKLGHMMAEAEKLDQAREKKQKANVGGISLMANYANNMHKSQSMAKDVMNQLERNERLKNVKLPKGDVSDAKAFLAYPKTNAGEYAKYTSTQAMIKQCQYDGYFKTRLQNYRQENAEQVAAVKATYASASTTPLRVNRNGVPESMQHIKTEKDAMKFVLNGGAQRHMNQAMGAMSAMNGEPGVSGNLMLDIAALGRRKLKTRRDYRGWSNEACTYLNQSISNGSLNVKRRKT